MKGPSSFRASTRLAFVNAAANVSHFPAATVVSTMSAKLEGGRRTVVNDVDHTIAGGDIRSCVL